MGNGVSQREANEEDLTFCKLMTPNSSVNALTISCFSRFGRYGRVLSHRTRTYIHRSEVSVCCQGVMMDLTSISSNIGLG